MFYLIGFVIFLIVIALISQIADNKKLVDCKACGAKISKSAKCCPHCGAKPAGQILGEAIEGIGCGLILAPIIIFIIVLYVIIGSVLN